MAPNVPIDQNPIQNLFTFVGKNMLRTAFMQFISTNLMTNQEKEVLYERNSKKQQVMLVKMNQFKVSNKIAIVYIKQYQKIKSKQKWWMISLKKQILINLVIQILQNLSHQLLIKKQQ
ncbi:unnamed protein product [Paramecium primaurelia]|uniref:Uncharacterized protein n=1 Tax=Paramecium primaurelia TaxID=5886 RepID=A0A8S1MAK0_PARPR|nr:unnamed protein product [Paramecium primaurelia]